MGCKSVKAISALPPKNSWALTMWDVNTKGVEDDGFEAFVEH